MKITTAFCVLGLILLPLAATARNTPRELSIQAALDSPLGQEKLGRMPLYFGPQSHPAIAKTLLTGHTHKATRSAFRSDEQACQIAFLSALIALQEQARAAGADAIVDIRSFQAAEEHRSSSTYQCAAGGAIARVQLEGKYVKLR